MQFVSSAGKWAWLRRSGGEVELFRGGPGVAPQKLGAGTGWSEIALAGDDLWLLNRTGNLAELLHSMTGGAPVSTLKDLPGAGGLYTAEERLFWVESPPSPSSIIPFTPAAGAASRVRVREASGQVRTVAELSGAQAGQPGDVIGVSNSQVYVRLRRTASTEFLRVPLAGGDWERLAATNGTQQGLLMNGTLYWTAPTEESNKVATLRCVHRLSASGSPETLTDWLPASGELQPSAGAPYYLASGLESALFQLPEHLDQARFVRSVPQRAALDGDQVINLDGPSAPNVVPAGHR